MIISALYNLDSETAQEIVSTMVGLSEDPALYERALGCVGNGVEVAVLSVEIAPCDGDPAWAGYYNIAFANGMVAQGVSGIHLKGIERFGR